MTLNGTQTNQQIVNFVVDSGEHNEEPKSELQRLRSLAGATNPSELPSWVMDQINVLQTVIEIYQAHIRGAQLNLNTNLSKELNPLILTKLNG